MRSYIPKADEITRDWVVLDASDQVLGRLATEAARLLRGKHKPTFTPHFDTGDFVVVVNAERVKMTGNKLDDKVYYRHSGKPGSLKSETARERMSKVPGAGDSGCGVGHAAQEPARPQASEKAQGLRRSRASARGAAAENSCPVI